MTSIKECAYFDPSKASEEEEEEEEEEAALETEEGAVEDEDNAQEEEESANKEIPVPEVSLCLLLCWFMNNVYSAKKVFVNWCRMIHGCGVKEFFFEFSARYRVEHKKRNSISSSNHVLICLLCKHLLNKKKPT